METAQLILEYIKALIWPIIVLFGFFLIRSYLPLMIEKLKTAKLPGGVTLDFEKELREAKSIGRDVINKAKSENKAKESIIPLTDVNARLLNLKLQPSPSGLDLGYYRDFVETDPNLALAGIRLELEIAAKNLAKGFNVEVGDKDSAGVMVRKLHESGAITLEQFQLSQQIVKLCNAAIHGQIISAEEAQSVIDVMKILSDQYISWLSQRRSGALRS